MLFRSGGADETVNAANEASTTPALQPRGVYRNDQRRGPPDAKQGFNLRKGTYRGGAMAHVAHGESSHRPITAPSGYKGLEIGIDPYSGEVLTLGRRGGGQSYR